MFYYVYVSKCNAIGKSPSAVAEEIGFKRSVVTRWSKGTQPRQATIQRIAEYFHCSVDDFLQDDMDQDSGLSQAQLDLIEIAKRLRPSDAAAILAAAKALEADRRDQDDQ